MKKIIMLLGFLLIVSCEDPFIEETEFLKSGDSFNTTKCDSFKVNLVFPDFFDSIIYIEF